MPQVTRPLMSRFASPRWQVVNDSKKKNHSAVKLRNVGVQANVDGSLAL